MTDPPATTPEKKPAPWRGRRRSDDVKGKCMTVRVTVKDRSKIAEAAGKAGLSVGEFVRTVTLGRKPPRAVKLPLVDRQQLVRLLGEFGKVGSNVNQIAKAFNSTGAVPATQELTAMKSRPCGDAFGGHDRFRLRAVRGGDQGRFRCRRRPPCQASSEHRQQRADGGKGIARRNRRDLRGALQEMEALADGTARRPKPLYHASINTRAEREFKRSPSACRRLTGWKKNLA